MALEELGLTFDELSRSGRHAAAVAACDRALLSERLTLAQRAGVLQLKARALMSDDRRLPGPAIECLREALQLTGPGTCERGEVLASFTAVYAVLGNAASCRRFRDEFVELVRYRSLPQLTRLYPRVEYNLAVCYHEADRLHEAEMAYLRAMAALDAAPDPTSALLPHICHNLVDVLQELNRHDEAYALLAGACCPLPDATHGAQIRNRKAVYALSRGDLTAALLWVESGLGHHSCDVKTRSALLLTKAKIAGASGNKEEAQSSAGEAMRLAAVAQCSWLSHRIVSFLGSL